MPSQSDWNNMVIDEYRPMADYFLVQTNLMVTDFQKSHADFSVSKLISSLLFYCESMRERYVNSLPVIDITVCNK